MNKTYMYVGVAAVLAVAGYFVFQNGMNQSADTIINQARMADTSTPAVSPATQTGTVVDVAVANGSFTTLVAAAKAAGLVETLSGTGPLTVFAPTDAAFAKLPAGTVEGLLKDPEKLKQILTYHVVSGKVMAADVVKLSTAKTVLGQDLEIAVKDDGVMVNTAKVVTTDVAASNGVIHVIDSVLLPK